MQNKILPPVLTADEKEKFLAYIKSVNLDEFIIPDEQANVGSKPKWYKFGAYDALRILATKVLADEQR